MTLPGGASDKLGNRYEGRWTLRCLVRVLEEQADSIRVAEPVNRFETLGARNY